MNIKQQIQELARSQGFLRPGFTPASDGVGSWMMSAFPYLPAQSQARRYFGLFACHDNYHHAVATMKKLRQHIAPLLQVPAKSMRIICNSSTEDERALAQAAGVGYIGKNTLIIVPDWGSLCALIGLYIPCAIPPDTSLDTKEFTCGSCTACYKNCPVGAVSAQGYHIDVPRCAQYWASSGLQPPQELQEQAPLMIYGCDRCQTCCPKNKPALTFYQEHEETADPTPWAHLGLWVNEDSSELIETLKKSPMRFSWLDKENLRCNAMRIFKSQELSESTEIPQ